MPASKKYTIEELYRLGQLSPSVIKYRDINDKVAQLRKSGMSRGAAIKQVARDLGVCFKTVYNSQNKGL